MQREPVRPASGVRSAAPTDLMVEAYEAWNRGDLDWILAHTSPDYVFRTAQLVEGVKPVYRGHEGAVEYWHTFRSLWETLSIEVERVEDLGDGAVLALLTFRGLWRDGGVEIIYQYAHLAVFEDSKCVQLRGFAGWNEALEAAGLAD